MDTTQELIKLNDLVDTCTPVLDFFVYGDPKAQKRHRHFARFGKGGKVFTGNYDPSKEVKESFIQVASQYAPSELYLGPLRVDLTFFMPRLKSHYGTGKKVGVLKPNAPYWHVSTPDVDNLSKLVYDSMKGVFWRDDSQICVANVYKIYSDNPGTSVRIYTFEF